jgi:methylase of polypeptide subunit release factors
MGMTDPQTQAHKDWLGYVQPTGLLVSIPALACAQVHLDRNAAPLQLKLKTFLRRQQGTGEAEPRAEFAGFPAFAAAILGWPREELFGAPPAPAVPEELAAPLPEYGEVLRPTYALREYQPRDPDHPWILLVQELPLGAELDRPAAGGSGGWEAAPQARLERLLRETGVPIGLLVNGRQLRLIYAPAGETSGYATFDLADMLTVAGRPILAALEMLLGVARLFSLPEDQRLPALLAASRRYQDEVSARLAEQVLEALYELVRGFQAADAAVGGQLLARELAADPSAIYQGLLTVLLRLVFILFAEDRGLLPNAELYLRHYSVGGLFQRLREDQGRFPDTMDQRHGAWAHLLATFRLIHRGARGGGIRLPSRQGNLFDPARHPFLQGTPAAGIPRLPDGVVYRVLSKLLVLEGQRLSYRSLDVEQIGSVYEAVMGFDLRRAEGRTIALQGAKRGAVAPPVNLDALLAVPRGKRGEWLDSEADQKLAGKAADALEKKIARSATPEPVAPGAMILVPTPERRRSGSHYTPRSLTHPIVAAALAPVLARLGPRPRSEQILALKVCDMACGSGAFLVETCRQLAEPLAAAWRREAKDGAPPLPPDEDELLHARRLIAQRCLYGVDKNPLAIELAKLSLWLATLARDHPFTFLDHALRAGDSLVGLSRAEIAAFAWPGLDAQPLAMLHPTLEANMARVAELRRRILDARDTKPYPQLEQELGNAESALSWPRLAADAAVAAFFAAGKTAARRARRQQLEAELLIAAQHKDRLELQQPLDGAVAQLHAAGIRPFHWQIEFPEVFGSADGGRRPAPSSAAPGGEGFDAIVGNPPFAGKNTITAGHPAGYLDWLQTIHAGAHGNADLAAHFYRRAFALLRPGGCLGLLATNTISQGDTRATGLRWLRAHGGVIYRARKRIVWPGEAAVVVSAVHIAKPSPGENVAGPYWLDGRKVDKITAFLSHAGGDDDPARLRANAGRSFQGSIILGLGFTFDDFAAKKKGKATSIAEMHRLIAANPRNQERIFPYIGGEEVNTDPEHAFHRYVINFEDFPLRREKLGRKWHDADERQRTLWRRDGIVPDDYPGPVAADWPDLLAIVEKLVKPERDRQGDEGGKRTWWQFLRTRPELKAALRGQQHALVISRVSESFAFAAVPTRAVLSDRLVVLPHGAPPLFAALQSRPHETWARSFSSSLEERLLYTPSDCFETFPFPAGYEASATLAAAGQAYHDFRARLMVDRDEGLTKTYNRFHCPKDHSPETEKLRALHAAMDRAVLDAYGWPDLQPQCDFFPKFADEDPGEAGKFLYRWPDEMQDEVLARLLDLNAQRAAAEGQLPAAHAAAASANDGPSRGGQRRASRRAAAAQLPLSTHS